MIKRDYQNLIEQSSLYKEILSKNKKNLSNMMFSFYSFAFLFSIIFYLIQRKNEILDFSCVNLGYLSFVFIVVVISLFRKTDNFSILFMLLLDLYFLFYSLRCPEMLYVEVILVAVFPIISYQFFKMKFALIANWTYFCCCFLFFFPLNRIMGFRNSESTYYFILLSTFILVSIISFYSSIENRNHLQAIIREMFYDKKTNLPDWNLLKLRLNPHLNEFVCLFRISNHIQIQKSSSMEISEQIFFQVKEKLVRHLEIHDLEMFKLRGMDFIFFWNDSYSVEDVQKQLDIIMDSFNLFSIRLDSSIIYIKTVAGIVPVQNSLDETMHLAEFALERAELNQISYWTVLSAQELDNEEEYRDSFQTLVDSIENDRMLLHFQPIVNVETQKLQKVEALIRFIGNEGQVLPIAPLLKSAYLSGMNNKMTILIVDKATSWAIENRCDISVNIAFEDLVNLRVVQTAIDAVKELEKNDLKITFEILETSELFEREKSIENLNKLREAGALIAIDDFGKGFANLDRILEFQPDIIKFDGSLIRELLVNEDARYLISMVCALAKKNRIITIAEHVENVALFEIVKQYGIDQAQGYFFGRPMEELPDKKKERIL